eukprot:13448449-Alexandrium_andersonii.AAC.1
MANVHVTLEPSDHSDQSTCGLEAMMSASHAEGRRLGPGQVYALSGDLVGQGGEKKCAWANVVAS